LINHNTYRRFKTFLHSKNSIAKLRMVLIKRQIWIVLLLITFYPAGCINQTIDAEEDVDVVVNNIRGVPLNESKDYTAVKNTDQSTTHLRKSDSTENISVSSSNGKGIFRKAIHKALGGGVPGAIAGVIQVLSLMWLRTVINYQYRYGSSFIQALTTLYGMGGIPRLYSGVSFALVQAPISRFISTAANDGVGVLLQSFNLGPGREVAIAALVVGFCRMLLMPIDTLKTVSQIENKKGVDQLLSKVRQGNIHLLYSGALANALSSFIGHCPWFYTYNLLSKNKFIMSIEWSTARNALIGFISSIVSDTIANSMRVIKTTKQSLGSTRSKTTYAETISLILAADGIRGLFGRGLKTRLLANALQSILFTVIWRGLSERWQAEKSATKSSDTYGIQHS